MKTTRRAFSYLSATNQMCIRILFLGFLGLWPNSASFGADPPLAVSVIPETRAVRQGDPLLLKIVIENVTERNVSILNPSRAANTLGLYVEVKPYTELFEAAQEGGDVIGLIVQIPEIVIKPKRRIVTYDRLFRYPDGDFVFRKDGPYKLYATIATVAHGHVKSQPITIGLGSRDRRVQDIIVAESSLLHQAFDPRQVVLSAPGGRSSSDTRSFSEQISDLEKLRQTVRRGFSEKQYYLFDGGILDAAIGWRIDLLRLKYGKDAEKDEARKRLEEVRGKLEARHEPAYEVLALQLARLALERGDWVDAKAEIGRIADDSPEKQAIARAIESSRKPPATSD